MNADCAAHGLNQAFANRQAKSRTAELVARSTADLVELLKEQLMLIRSNANSGVRNFHADLFAVLCRLRTQRHRDPSFLGEFDGVVQEVQKNLAYPCGIALNPRRNAPTNFGAD